MHFNGFSYYQWYIHINQWKIISLMFKFRHSVETIGDYAFQSCSSLKNIIIPNSVTFTMNDLINMNSANFNFHGKNFNALVFNYFVCLPRKSPSFYFHEPELMISAMSSTLAELPCQPSFFHFSTKAKCNFMNFLLLNQIVHFSQDEMFFPIFH